MSEQRVLQGGCLCREIRYSIGEIFDSGYCHCSLCRKGTGGICLVWAHVKGKEFSLLQGTPCKYSFCATGFRCFCGTCGSPLYFEHCQQAYYSINVGTLDEPERVPPQIHMCVESRVSWLRINDGLLEIEGNRLPHPDNREK